MSEEPYVSIVMPAYNEAARLPASLDRVLAFAAGLPHVAEVIVCDDGSSDATPEIVRRAQRRLEDATGPQLRLEQHGQNRGKGAAIRTGVLAAAGKYVFFLDADLATPPEELPKLLLALEGGADVAIGSRIQADGSDMRASQPLQRRLVGRAFTLARMLLRVLPDIDDTQCPLKGFRREAAQAIFQRQRLSGWIFDAEVLYIARRQGRRILSAPVTWRHVEGSRLSVRPQMAFEIARDLIRLRLRR